VPGLPEPLADRKACPPNDMRRANGVVGLLRAGPSSSSIAFSSKESEPAVETLPRRPPKVKGVDWVGDVPDKPRVEIDMRRRWSCAAAVVIGPGKGAVGAPDELLDRAKMLLKVWVVNEPRRGFADSLAGLLSLLPDIVRCGFVRRLGGLFRYMI